MITKYIEIPEEKWGVVIVYDFDRRDRRELAAIMDSFGMEEENVAEAIRILSHPNTGMTLSVSTLRMSVIFVSHTTSSAQFWDTLLHETVHVADAILDFYGERWGDESSAYLVGFMTKELVEELAIPCR